MGYSAMETPRTPAAKVHRFWLAALVRAPAVEAVEAGVPVAVPPVTDMVGVEKSRVRVLVGMTKLVAAPLIEGVVTLSSGLLLGLLVGLLLGVSLAVTEAKVLETAAEEPLALTAPPPSNKDCQKSIQVINQATYRLAVRVQAQTVVLQVNRTMHSSVQLS